MDKRKFVQNVTIIVLAVAIIVMSVGYAFYFTPMDLTGTTTIKSSSWSIYFTNYNPLNTTTVPTERITGPSLTKTTSASFAVELQMGEVYDFTLDIENAGTFDAKLDTVTFTAKNGNTVLESDGNHYSNAFLDYDVTYANGDEIDVNDELDSKTTKTIKVHVQYKTPENQEDLPGDDDLTYTFRLDLRYIQK